MAQAKFIPIMTATSGLNNALDPVRISFDPKTGVTELSQAVNINIDNSGRVSRRLGRTQKSSVAARCGFADGETCLYVSGSTLRQLKPDYSNNILRSDLTEGARMRYQPIAGRIYYTNGSEKGYVYKGADYEWVKGTYTIPGDSGRVFSNPPNGHLVGWFSGRALIARDNALFASEPSFYSVFDLHRGFRLVRDRITMTYPTSKGLWVGTTTQVLFYRGSQWEQMRREVKADYGVLEGSDVICPGEKIGSEERAVIFTTPQGICAGSENGSFNNMTYNKLIFPAGHYASATMAGDRYLVLIEP